jgi:hypothetical protein
VQHKDNSVGGVTYSSEVEGGQSSSFKVDYYVLELRGFQVNSGSKILCMKAVNLCIYSGDGFGKHAVMFRILASGKYEGIQVLEWHEDIQMFQMSRR